MRTLNREDLVNILYGAAILGTGGGGSLTEGIELIRRSAGCWQDVPAGFF